MREDKREPVAIVGIGCRLPGGIASPREFWRFLCDAGDAISEVPADRWDRDALYAEDSAVPGKTYVRHGGFLRDIGHFDPAFFTISPREAASIDPQQRLILETAHEAMEDAGERWEDPKVRRTGVFVGVFIHDYQHMQFADRAQLGAHTGTGSAMSITANRVSYCFDLQGPSVAVDTACSSALVAIDMACKSLLSGECDYALAGGVNVILKPEMTIAMSKANMLSRDGRCKSFDASANGYVRGEGAGMLLLCRLSAARADGNPVYASILASGVNSDGRTKGISVPNGQAQEDLTRSVLREAGIPAASVQYVEAHGTGTPVGDPIEAAALGRVFREGRADGDRCLIGSVKTNVGHLESASGVVGLIKAALCLKHATIPPSLHFRQPNPAIDFDGLKLEVVTAPRCWPVGGGPRRAAINSFGFGGTNAHAILEQAPDEQVPGQAGGVTADSENGVARLILPTGAHDSAALRALAGHYADQLAADPSCVQDLLYTVSQRRSHGSHRAAVTAATVGDLEQGLRQLAAGARSDAVTSGTRLEAFAGRPVFVFAGMGPQWWGMGRELLLNEPTFRGEVERVDEKLRPLTGWSILEQLLADEKDSQVQRTNVAQPAIFAIQAGLSALWRRWGVEPAATMGHSVGEVAALYAAGILTLDDAVTVVYHRSRLHQRTAGSGGMLAAAIDVNRAADLLRDIDGPIAVAAINSPCALTLSGDVTLLQGFQRDLKAQGIFARMLKVEVPYHSPQMDTIRVELLAALAGIEPRAGHCPYYSTTDGRDLKSALGDGQYWWRNVRQTVRFAAAIGHANEDGHACFLEIGPHPVLLSSIRESLDGRDGGAVAIGSLRHNRSDFEVLSTSLADLHVAGVTIDWKTLHPRGRLMSLPLYPWQRQRHWSESKEAEQHRKGLSVDAPTRTLGTRHALLGGRVDLALATWTQTIRLAEHRYLADHKVQGTVVFPGTGYLEMALQTLRDGQAEDVALPASGECLLLGDVDIGRALYLGEEDEVRLETTRNGDRWQIHGRGAADGGWVRHAAGRCWREKSPGPPAIDAVDIDEIRVRCSKPLAADYAYRLFRDVGLDYGPSFRAIQQLWYAPGEALALLQLPAGLGPPGDAVTAGGFLFHPALLDACLHTLFGALNLNGEDSDLRGNTFLPVSVRLLRVYRPQASRLWSHAQVHTRKAQYFDANVRIFDESGALVAEVVDLRCQALEHPATVALRRRQEWMFEYQWDPSPMDEPPGARQDERWLVLAPDAAHPVVSVLGATGAQCIVAVPGPGFDRRSHDYTVSPVSPEDFRRLLADVERAAGPLTGIVHAFGLGGDHDLDDPARSSHQETGAGSLMHLVQALSREQEAPAPERTVRDDAASEAPAPRLWVLTDRAQAIPVGSAVRLAHSTIWGLRRVIANEHPHLAARIVDLDGTPASWAALSNELAHQSDDDEIAFRDGTRLAHRLRRFVPPDPDRTPSSTSSASSLAARIELDVPQIGDIRSMRWIPLPSFQLGDEEVEIEVDAAGINFKDVLKATGLFPARLLAGNLWSHETLGMECAGRVVRVGARVQNVKFGDQVMALAPRAFASHVITHRKLVAPNPGLTAAAAAGIPVAFLTASVALEHLARLQPGERVLIHAATGGVGQAAIQIAQDLGAEIFATAGNLNKRQLLGRLGVAHVLDSRSLRFAEEIRDLTGGAGVDVVLNSLTGEAITHGLSVLSDYGRFIEIGKMDLDRDFPLGLRPFTRCLSFHSVDLDRMLAQRVPLCGQILNSIHQRLVTGRLRALPVTTFDASKVADAFGLMAGAGHTGKLIVDVGARRGVVVNARAGISLRADASYLISGGLGGFGLQLAVWLATRGAGRLVLLGRRGWDTPGARDAVARLEALGCEVQIEACDVADATQVRQALSAVPATRPLRGVFHAAAVLDDALIKNLDLVRYQRTFAPKAAGAWNLHEFTLDRKLDHFMCFSSMASILGNQGSANYCAANAFVDALAHHRRSLELPALTVNWGVIADVGMAADEDFYRQNLERNGLRTIHSSHCLQMLELLLESERVQTTVCPIDFETWLRFNPAGKERRLNELSTPSLVVKAKGAQAVEEVALRAALASLDRAGRAELALAKVRDLLADVFRTEASKIDASRSLTDLGADSLLAIEIKNRLDALGLAMSVTQLLNRKSGAILAAHLLGALGYHDEKGSGPIAHVPRTRHSQASSWFLRREPRPDAKLRLFCFPYAGGSASIYNAWSEHLPAWVDVVAVSLPGRGVRIDEPNLESISATADIIGTNILPLLDRPFALFGHCMGAIMMYEVAQRLQDDHQRSALHLFASGCMAPHLYNSPVVHEQDDAAFLDVLRLISFSGTRALLDDLELRKQMLPSLRSDFRAVAEYGTGFRRRAPLTAPITGLAANSDLFAAPKAMGAWDDYTSGGYELAQLSGDHYFLESDRRLVTAIVASRLAKSAGLPLTAPPALDGVLWTQQLESRLGALPLASERRQPPLSQRTFRPGPTRVFCFPSAGLRTTEFTLPVDRDGAVVYTPVEWRGSNGKAPRTMGKMVDHAYAAVRGRLDERIVFYGHCLGAIVAYELALLLQREGLPLPQHLLVTGVVGPHLYVAPNAHQLPGDKLLELLTVLKYPLAQDLRGNPECLEDRMTLIRADLEAMANYQYQPDEPLQAPITAISLRHDLWSYPLRTTSWKSHTQATFRVEEWEGDHYNSIRHPERLHAVIRSLCG